MVSFAPSFVFVFPIAVLAATRREWAVRFFAVSVPFFALRPVTVFGHPFTAPEFAILSLGFANIIYWVKEGRIYIPRTWAIKGMLGFLLIGFLSIFYTYVAPNSVMVHPYNSGSLDFFVLKPLSVSRNNFTQYLLRILSLSSIFLLAVVHEAKRLKLLIRWVILGAVLTGISGIGFQLSILTGTVEEFSTVAKTIGFYGFKPTIGSFGPVPRMFSTVGEPGYTAHYLLYSLSLSLGLFLFDDRNVFERSELKRIIMLLFVFLVLTTSTTGYGGLLIMFCCDNSCVGPL